MATHSIKIFPPIVQDYLREISEDKRNLFSMEFDSRRKGKAGAYICWILLGCHYAYLHRWGRQIIFWLTAGGLGLWWLLDAFLMPEYVNQHNKDVSRQIMRDMKN